jgi:hypothetical protein
VNRIPFPTSGGSYRLVEGQLVIEGELVNDDPAAAPAPPIEQVDTPVVADAVEREAEPGQALPPIQSTPSASATSGRRKHRQE